MTAGVHAVLEQHAGAAHHQESWAQWEGRLKHDILPLLARHTETVRTTPTDVPLRRLGRSQARLARLRRGLWRHPHLISLRLRNTGLWFVAYRDEIATAILSVAGLLLLTAVVYLVVVNYESIATFIQSVIEQVMLELKV